MTDSTVLLDAPEILPFPPSLESYSDHSFRRQEDAILYYFMPFRFARSFVASKGTLLAGP